MMQEKYWEKVLWKYTKNSSFNLLTKCEKEVYNISKNDLTFLLKNSMVKKYEIMYYSRIRKLTVNSFEKLGRKFKWQVYL